MVDVLPLLAAVGVIVLWCLGLYGLQRRGLLEPHGLQPSPPPAGPFLMWKTVRGRQLIDRLARPKRFWRVFGDIAIVLVALTMLGTTVLLAWEATLVQNAAIRSNPPSPETLLGLPGINPIIPLGYGILGLAVAIILHEFSHGILSRVANIKIRSLGLIFLIFPIGAFVEPDEDELRALPRRERGRLDRKSTRLNSSHLVISYAVFCLKKKKKIVMFSYIHVHRFSRLLASPSRSTFFFFNDTATTEIYTLSLHDALPISRDPVAGRQHQDPIPRADFLDLPDRGVRRTGRGRAPRTPASRTWASLRGRARDECLAGGPVRHAVLDAHLDLGHTGPRRSRDCGIHAELSRGPRGDAAQHGHHVDQQH